MKVLITGSSGLVGSDLVPALVSGGHETVRLVRRSTAGTEVHWNPDKGEIDSKGLEGIDGVVHLAGAGIADRRWSESHKTAIRESRIQGTHLLATALAGMDKPPSVLVCASAIGYYGDRGEEVLTEESPAGAGFLAEVCEKWESAADPARDKGIRVVHLRIGIVLSAKGGALKKMLTPIKMGVGGRMGSGKQYWSWVAIDDVVGAAEFALANDNLSGAVNTVAPEAPTNLEFTKVLARVLSRPAVFPMPGFAAKLMLGEMAEALLLSSARVVPTKLKATGYSFRQPQLENALRSLLGR